MTRLADRSTKAQSTPKHVVFQFINELTDRHLLSALSATEIRVLLVYIRHADANGESFPGPDRIASAIGTDSRHVKRARASLVQSGFLEKTNEGGGRAHIAHFRLRLPPETVAISATVRDSFATETVAENAPETGTDWALNHGGIGTETVADFDTNHGGIGTETVAESAIRRSQIRSQRRPPTTTAADSDGDAVFLEQEKRKFWEAKGVDFSIKPKARLGAAMLSAVEASRLWGDIVNSKGVTNRPAVAASRLAAIADAPDELEHLRKKLELGGDK